MNNLKVYLRIDKQFKEVFFKSWWFILGWFLCRYFFFHSFTCFFFFNFFLGEQNQLNTKCKQLYFSIHKFLVPIYSYRIEFMCLDLWLCTKCPVLPCVCAGLSRIYLLTVIIEIQSYLGHAFCYDKKKQLFFKNRDLFQTPFNKNTSCGKKVLIDFNYSLELEKKKI